MTELANSTDPDEAVHNETPHLNLKLFALYMYFLNCQYDTAWMKQFLM